VKDGGKWMGEEASRWRKHLLPLGRVGEGQWEEEWMGEEASTNMLPPRKGRTCCEGRWEEEWMGEKASTDMLPSRKGGKLIAGNCRGLISLSRLKGPANHSFEGFLLSLFPLRSTEREREGQKRVAKL
jgi:hypothetical protein